MSRKANRNKKVRFDDALPFVVNAIFAKHAHILEHAAFLRAADGRITVVVSPEHLKDQLKESLAKTIIEAGGAYVDPHGPCATPDELFQPDLLDADDITFENVEITTRKDKIKVRLIDRRIVGQDWSRPNFKPIEGVPPVVSFFSCKGGVGRSTAIAITAAGLASEGRNLLIIDLDLEAPGLGALLLGEGDRPEFGAIDYLIENGISGIDSAFVRDCIAPSPLTRGGSGQVDVLPAIGQRGLKYPENLIPKLGRAVLDDAGDPLVLQVRKLLADAAKTKRYDAIFVDVRAGLSESSAAALLSLGGDMLLFGVDAPQTFEDYRYLFAHLNRYAGFDDWRSRLQMVQAKSPGRADDLRGFRERASDLFAEYIYDEIPAGTAPNDLFNFDIDDDTAPHYPWVVEFDQTYLQFDPTTRPEQLEAERFQRAFGGFLERIRDLIFSDSEE